MANRVPCPLPVTRTLWKGFSMDELEVQNLVVELDADNSGSINLEEFEVWYLEDKKKRAA